MLEQENYADESDIASAIEEHSRTANIQMILKSGKQKQFHPDFDGKHCVECGDEMPELRLKNGRIRCTECESILEKKLKIQGHI